MGDADYFERVGAIVEDVGRKRAGLIDRIRALLGFHGPYRAVFLEPGTGVPTREGGRVLRDLARFCHAHDTTFYSDQRQADRMAARREVYLHIMEGLRFDGRKMDQLQAQLKEMDGE